MITGADMLWICVQPLVQPLIWLISWTLGPYRRAVC